MPAPLRFLPHFLAPLALTCGALAAGDGGATLAQGRRLYVEYGCWQCHGYEGQGALATGPRLAPGPLPLEAFVELVRRPPGVMPAYSPRVIGDEALARMHAWLASITAPQDGETAAR